jgi:hypothetical protein
MANDGLVKMRVTVPYQGGDSNVDGGMLKVGTTIRVTPQRAEELEKKYKVAERVEEGAAASDDQATDATKAKRGK